MEMQADTVTPEASNTMDKDHADGLAKEAKGSVKEAIGKLTGNLATQAEGKVERDAGKAEAAGAKAANTATTKDSG